MRVVFTLVNPSSTAKKGNLRALRPLSKSASSSLRVLCPMGCLAVMTYLAAAEDQTAAWLQPFLSSDAYRLPFF